MKIISLRKNQKRKIRKNNAVALSYDHAIHRGRVSGGLAARNKIELFFRKHFLSVK